MYLSSALYTSKDCNDVFKYTLLTKTLEYLTFG